MTLKEAQYCLKFKKKVIFKGKNINNLKGDDDVFELIDSIIVKFEKGEFTYFASLLDKCKNSIFICKLSEVEVCR